MTIGRTIGSAVIVVAIAAGAANAKAIIGPSVRGAEVSVYGSADDAEHDRNAHGSVAPAALTKEPVRILKEAGKAYQILVGGKSVWVNRGDVTTDDEQRQRCQKRGETTAGRGLGCD
jgi:hypothetical protein